MFLFRRSRSLSKSTVSRWRRSTSIELIGIRKTGRSRQLSVSETQNLLCVRAYLHVWRNSRRVFGSHTLLRLKAEVQRMISFNSLGASPDHPSFGGAGDFVPKPSDEQ